MFEAQQFSFKNFRNKTVANSNIVIKLLEVETEIQNHIFLHEDLRRIISALKQNLPPFYIRSFYVSYKTIKHILRHI